MKDTLKRLAYYAAKVVFGAVALVYFRLSVVGRERVPAEGPVIIAANHFSLADPALLGIALPRRLWFVMAQEMFRKVHFYAFSRLMDVIPVQPGGALPPSALKKVMRVLHGGRCLGIFPEGQRSRTGRLLEPQRGVGLFAQRGRAPLLPVAILGTREAWPPGVWFPRPRKVRVVVGEPIPYDAEPTPEALALRVRDAIAALLVRHGAGDYVGESDPAAEEAS